MTTEDKEKTHPRDEEPYIWGMSNNHNPLKRAELVMTGKTITPLIKSADKFITDGKTVPPELIQLFCPICHGYASRPCERCTIAKNSSKTVAYQDVDHVVECSNCKNLMHSHCLDRWLLNHRTIGCPSCNNKDIGGSQDSLHHP